MNEITLLFKGEPSNKRMQVERTFRTRDELSIFSPAKQVVGEKLVACFWATLPGGGRETKCAFAGAIGKLENKFSSKQP